MHINKKIIKTDYNRAYAKWAKNTSGTNVTTRFNITNIDIGEVQVTLTEFANSCLLVC